MTKKAFYYDEQPVTGETRILGVTSRDPDDGGVVGLFNPSDLIGPEGPQGPQGDPGPQGPVGATGAAGTNGTNGAAGATGATGPKGDKGDKGDPGTPGVDGADGAAGPQGPAGAAGGAGPQGPAGAGMVPNEYGGLNEAKVTAIETADVDWNLLVVIGGDTRVNKTVPSGINGDMGGHLVHFRASDNTWWDIGPVSGVEGPAGPQGNAGPAGSDGAQGPVGPAGPAGPAGADGTDGVDGADGAPGATGPAGADGADGAPGAVGPKGDKGDTGNTGAQGPQGNTGPTGAKGDKGDTGNTGAQGPGVPTGGAIGAHLRKKSATDNDTEWGLGVRIVTVTAANYTLLLSDADAYLSMTNSGAKALTVPTNASVAFPINTEIFVANNNDADVNLTLTPASGVTIRKPNDQLYTLPRWAGACLVKIGTNEWVAYGGMTPQ